MVGSENGGDRACRLTLPFMPTSHSSEAIRNGENLGWFLGRFLASLGNQRALSLTTMLVSHVMDTGDRDAIGDLPRGNRFDLGHDRQAAGET
jgi:hypothetical protein